MIRFWRYVDGDDLSSEESLASSILRDEVWQEHGDVGHCVPGKPFAPVTFAQIYAGYASDGNAHNRDIKFPSPEQVALKLVRLIEAGCIIVTQDPRLEGDIAT